MGTVPLRIVVALVALAGLTAAASPAMLAHVSGGLWEVSRSASGAAGVRLCVADPERLVTYEHGGAACRRTVIADRADEAVVSYSCAGAGFGQTRITLLTPRSLRLDTQGIKRGEPFSYVVHARLVGRCGPR